MQPSACHLQSWLVVSLPCLYFFQRLPSFTPSLFFFDRVALTETRPLSPRPTYHNQKMVHQPKDQHRRSTFLSKYVGTCSRMASNSYPFHLSFPITDCRCGRHVFQSKHRTLPVFFCFIITEVVIGTCRPRMHGNRIRFVVLLRRLMPMIYPP